MSAVILSTVFCVLFTLGGSIGDVANLINVGVFLVLFMLNSMLLVYRFKVRNRSTPLEYKFAPLALNIGWFPLLPFLDAAFCLLMLLTQFWQPMMVFGKSIPIIVLASISTAYAVPIFLLNRNYQK